MRKKLTSFIGLILSVGVATSAQAQLSSERSTLASEFSNVGASTITEQHIASVAEQSTVRLEVSLSRRQVTVYNGDTPAQTYPIAVGRAGHQTPTGTFEIRQMRRNPTWIHPITDQRIKGGDPGNPLGTRWLGFWTDGRNWIGFHGTTSPGSIGQAVSHGCLRMHNADVEELFEQVEIGTRVTVVN